MNILRASDDEDIVDFVKDHEELTNQWQIQGQGQKRLPVRGICKQSQSVSENVQYWIQDKFNF